MGDYIGVVGGAGGGGGSATDLFPEYLADTLATGSSRRTPFTLTAVIGSADAAWTEIVASLSADSNGITVAFDSPILGGDGANNSVVLEIATGAAASEVVWAIAGVGYSRVGGIFTIPGFIASGTRVSARLRGVVAYNFTASYYFIKKNSLTLGAPVTMGGANIATTSRGITLTNPIGTNTAGAWTEIVASSSQDISALLVTIQAAADTVMAAAAVLVDIGIGGSGSETMLIEGLYALGTTTEYYVKIMPQTFGVNIPSGTRIVARYWRANTANPVDVILVGA